MIIASDSLEVEITINKQDGTALDFSAATGILVAVYQRPDRVIARFSKVAKDDYTTMEAGQLSAAATGKLTLYLNSEDTTKLDQDKKVYAEVRISFTNANFTDSTQTVTASDIELELVDRPILENIATT